MSADSEWVWEYLETAEPRPCAVCGATTNLVDLDFETAICSVACVQSMWDDYCRDTILAALGEEPA